VDDAEGLAEILQDPERCAYPQSQVHILTGPQATRGGIVAKLDQLARDTTLESTIVFYFSGHGYQVDTSIGQAYYLIPSGYDLSRLKETAISGAELTERLRAILGKKMLLLFDCCHAGGLGVAKDLGLELTKAPLPPEASTLLGQGSGCVIISSSQADELSYAGKPYSAFTLALIEALAGKGASKQDGFVRVADLAMYAREMVPRRTYDRQHPILNFEAADNFVVAYYAGGGIQPKDLLFTEEPQIEPEPGAFTFQQSRGTFVGENMTMGRDFAGRDRIGDEVGGDKIQIGGSISGTGIAIGHSQVHVSHGISGSDLSALFAPIMQAVQNAPLDKRDEAMRTAQALKEELAKDKKADDSRIAKLVDQLVGLVPSAVTTVVSTFASPILGGLAGPVTRFVLDKIQGK
jgi:hypothetical protein